MYYCLPSKIACERVNSPYASIFLHWPNPQQMHLMIWRIGLVCFLGSVLRMCACTRCSTRRYLSAKVGTGRRIRRNGEKAIEVFVEKGLPSSLYRKVGAGGFMSSALRMRQGNLYEVTAKIVVSVITWNHVWDLLFMAFYCFAFQLGNDLGISLRCIIGSTRDCILGQSYGQVPTSGKVWRLMLFIAFCGLSEG